MTDDTVEPAGRLRQAVAVDELTATAAARYLGASVAFVRSQLAAGELPATLHGRTWQIRVDDLNAWVERQRIQHPAAEGRPRPGS